MKFNSIYDIPGLCINSLLAPEWWIFIGAGRVHHHQEVSPSNVLYNWLFFVSTFSPWLIFRFSSESGSYTTTTLQLTHGSFSPSQSSNSLKTDLNKLRLLQFCNFSVVIVAILRSEQKSETGVAFAVQWVARSWLPGRCKFPHRFHTHLRNWESNKIKGWRVSHIHGGAVRSTKTHGLWGKTRQEKKLLSPGCWLLIIWIIIQVAAGKNRNTPVLVHCSAGVGRSVWRSVWVFLNKRICVNGYLIFQNGRDDTLRHFEILRRSQHWHWHSKGEDFFKAFLKFSL